MSKEIKKPKKLKQLKEDSDSDTDDKQVYCMPCNSVQCEDYCDCDNNDEIDYSQFFNTMQKAKQSKCIIEGCKKPASYCVKKSDVKTHCFVHKLKGMVLLRWKPQCTEENCKTAPIFNFPNEKRGIYCFKHKKETMIDVKNIKCTEPGCNQQPTYGIEGNKTALRCKMHKSDNMVDIKHAKCKASGCTTRPSFNVAGSSKGLYCIEHKKDGMVDVVSDQCAEKDCTTRPSYGLPNGSATHCVKHKTKDMIDVVHDQCRHEDCIVRPTFGVEGTKLALYCEDHTKPGLVNVVSKICEHKGCKTLAGFNFRDKPAKFCNKHKEENMVDVNHVKCKTELCDTRPSSKFEGYCLYCFVHLFPDKEISRNYKTKEQAVLDFVKTEFPDISWIHDKPIGESLRRPDILANLNDKVIIIEVDEDQHNSYQDICENKRIMQISKDLNHKNISFIRFNPDKYTIKNTSTPSCWTINKKGLCVLADKPNWDKRLDVLKEKVKIKIKSKQTKMIDIENLFFSN